MLGEEEGEQPELYAKTSNSVVNGKFCKRELSFHNKLSS